MRVLQEQMTSGVLKALSKGKKRTVCSCGFPIPVYPGRYPSKCPLCGEPLKKGTDDAASAPT